MPLKVSITGRDVHARLDSTVKTLKTLFCSAIVYSFQLCTLSDDYSFAPLLQEQRVVRFFNVAKTGEPHSPDSVLDIIAASKRQRTQQEMNVLEALRQKVEAECSQVRACEYICMCACQ